MASSTEWTIPKPVAFALVLGLLMMVGETVSGGGGNPLSVGFYCFLPAALWMIVNDQNRDKEAIAELRTRIRRLEEVLSEAAEPVTAHH
ncbi:MAG: hypothetical protein ACKOTB_07755 [Planctomycetia bacterium]